MHNYEGLVKRWKKSDKFPFNSVEDYFKEIVPDQRKRDLIRLDWAWDHVSDAFSLIDGLEGDKLFKHLEDYHTKLDSMSSNLLNLTEGLKDA